MIAVLFFGLQAVAPQQMVMATSSPVDTAQAQEEPAQPEQKRVCRSVLDTRVGLIAKRQTVCHFVRAEAGKAK